MDGETTEIAKRKSLYLMLISWLEQLIKTWGGEQVNQNNKQIKLLYDLPPKN